MMLSKTIKILKTESGASFLFVLGIMTFLLAIGASSLVAASSNTGFAINHFQHNRIAILEDSIHRNILHQLQLHTDTVDEENHLSKDSLTYYLVSEVYYEALENGFDARPSPQAITIGLINGSGARMELSGLDDSIILPPVIFDFVRPRVFIDATHQSAVNFNLLVTVRLEAFGKRMMSQATYTYRNGLLTDTKPEEKTDDDLEIVSGEWELVKYEKLEQ